MLLCTRCMFPPPRAPAGARARPARRGRCCWQQPVACPRLVPPWLCPSAHTSRCMLLGMEPTCARPGPVVLRGPGALDPSAAGQAVPSHRGASRGGARAGTPLPVWVGGGTKTCAVSCRSRGWWEGEAPHWGRPAGNEGHPWPGQQTTASLGAGLRAHGHKGQVCPFHSLYSSLSRWEGGGGTANAAAPS